MADAMGLTEHIDLEEVDPRVVLVHLHVVIVRPRFRYAEDGRADELGLLSSTRLDVRICPVPVRVLEQFSTRPTHFLKEKIFWINTRKLHIVLKTLSAFEARKPKK